MNHTPTDLGEYKKQQKTKPNDAQNSPAKNKLPDGLQLTPDDLKRLHKLNQAPYVHTTCGGKNLVIGVKQCQVQGLVLSFETPGEFYKKFMHEDLIGDPKTANKRKNLGKAWMEWSGKNYKPGGTGFYPDPKKCPEDVFNFWQGHQVKPIKGDCSVILDHLQNVICNRDEVVNQYLIGWMAHIVQKPDIKASVAVLIKSVEGVGKGTLAELLLRIFGPHATSTNGAYSIAGRFNSTIANRLFIFVDEADLTDRHVADRLKAIISEPRVNLERKGLEIESLPNYCRLMFASNHDIVLKAGIRERRYLVLEPDESFAQNRDYFKKLWHWIDHEDGPAKFLDYLKNYDISEFDPYRAPQTAALIREKLSNLHGATLFIYEELTKENPFDGIARMKATELVSDFQKWAETKLTPVKLPSANSQIGKMMQKIGVPSIGRSDRGDGIVYEFPDKVSMVSAFCKFLDIPEAAMKSDFF